MMLDLDICFGGQCAYGQTVDIYVDNHRYVFAKTFYGYTRKYIIRLIKEEMRQIFGVKRFKTTIFRR